MNDFLSGLTIGILLVLLLAALAALNETRPR